MPLQIPSPVSLLAYISQAEVAFEQYTNMVSKESPRPATAAEEIQGHSYALSATGEPRLQYRVLLTRPAWRPAVAEPPAPGTDAFFEEQYGALCKEGALSPLFDTPPLELIRAAWKHGGGEPPERHSMSIAYVSGSVLDLTALEQLLAFRGTYAQWKEDGMALAHIAEGTIGQHTRYKLPSHGAPQVKSQTVQKCCTNGAQWMLQHEAFADFLRRRGAGTEEEEGNAALVEHGATKLDELLQVLREGVGGYVDGNAVRQPRFDTAVQVLLGCCRVVVTVALTSGTHAGAPPEEEEEEEPEEPDEPGVPESEHAAEGEVEDRATAQDDVASAIIATLNARA